MLKSQEGQRKCISKFSFFESNRQLDSTDKTRRLRHKTLSQSANHPRVQNKKLKYYKTTHSSFFNHLNQSKKVENQELFDSSFNKFLDNVRNNQGFKGIKTHSHNQLVYLTPQKRHKNSSKQLTQVKKQLYQLIVKQTIKTEPCENTAPGHGRTSLVQFITNYNPEFENYREVQAQDYQIKPMSKYQTRRSGHVFRQKLKSYNKNSQYNQKLKNYQMIFKGYKLT